jgi:arylsulfatase A
MFLRTWAGFLALSILVSAAGAAERPNVLLIMADDLGFEGLSCYGSTSYATPHLDRLAKEGARFEYCYSQPLCTPTRVEIMTGRYYFRNYTMFGQLKQGERTFGHMMQAGGYRTAVAGKWQLDGGEAGQSPAAAGFDEYCLWNLKVGDLVTTRTRYADASLLHYDRRAKGPSLNEYKGAYGPDVCAQYLKDFIANSVGEGRPFFAYYPMILTHGPFKPTPRSSDWNDGNRHRQDKKYFKDMVEYMDDLVGELVKHLDELGVRRSTLVIFTGDNGTPGGIKTRMRDQRTIVAGKGLARDSGTHVPLVVSWPGKIRPGQIRRELVDMSDFLPTIADATGAPMPDVSGDWVVDGRSFLPPLLGRKGNPRTHVVVDYREPRQDGFGWPKARFVRDHRYKLYGFYERKNKKTEDLTVKTGHFYDTVKDPEEEHPLDSDKASDSANSARARLAQALESLPAIKK